MDARRFDALARALTKGASRRRLLQVLPGVAVGGLLPRAGSALALDGGDVVGCPTPVGGRACSAGADCGAGEICLNGVCATNGAAGSGATAGTGDVAVAQDSTAVAGGGSTAAQAPTAVADAGTDGEQEATATAAGAGGGQEATETPAAVTRPGADDAEATSTPIADDADATATPVGDEAEATATAAGDDAEATATPADEEAEGTTTPATGVGAQISPNQPLAVQLHEGVCGSLNATPAFPLIDIGAAGGGATPVADGAPDGQSTAVPAGISTTIVDVEFVELLSSPYAIDVRLDADDPASSIACGDIGAPSDVPRPDDALAVGLTTRNGSGYAGIGYVQDEGERVVVTVFAAPGLAGGGGTDAVAVETVEAAEAPGFAAGLSVTVTEAVNLRAAPSTDAEVVGELPAGLTVTVTAAAVDGWVPVSDPATGRPGYVSAEYVALAEGE